MTGQEVVRKWYVESWFFDYVCVIRLWDGRYTGAPKVLMQGKLIAVAYTLRTYWNQFSLSGICKQEYASVFARDPRRIKAFNFDNFDNSHNSFLWPEYFIDYFCENGFHVRLWHPSCVYINAQRQYTAVKKCVHLWINFPCISTLGAPCLPSPLPYSFYSLRNRVLLIFFSLHTQ